MSNLQQNFHQTLSSAIAHAGQTIVDHSQKVAAKKWQGVDVSNKPEMVTHEVLFYSFAAPASSWSSDHLNYLRDEVKPNLPWADDHFLERVGGQPLNPGKQWANWPYASSADKFRNVTGEGAEVRQFSHTYMERYWPRLAGHTDDGTIHGIDLSSTNLGYRFRYGDLRDLVNQLSAEPDTRQAYLPVWFPEDTGVVHGGRVPCTLGYHVIVRRGFAHIVYYLRSCDYMRHFRDDIYLTVRLLLWIIEECRKTNPAEWQKIVPGSFTMHISSLHVFENDLRILRSQFAPKTPR